MAGRRFYALMKGENEDGKDDVEVVKKWVMIWKETKPK